MEKELEKRRQTNEKLMEWLIKEVITEYADDISLVLIYGSYVNGTDNSKSDVDCYFVPKREKGYNLAKTFIIDGVGYDIFPMSWERVERIADLKEFLTSLVGDVQILYCNSSNDLAHFKALQEKLNQNLSNEEYVKKIAFERFKEAGRMCSQMKVSKKPSDIRKMAGNIIMALADTVAVYNQDYYHFGLKKQFDDLKNKFSEVPHSIKEMYENVVKSGNDREFIEHTLQMYKEVSKYLKCSIDMKEAVVNDTLKSKNRNISYTWLAALYEEISSTFNKIYVCCEDGNYILAFLSAVCLQRDLDDAWEIGCPEYDLLREFQYTELNKLSEKTHDIESDLVRVITEGCGKIKKYASFEEFELAKL